MKRSIATVSLPGTLEQKIKAIARAGYQGFELFEPDLTASSLSPIQVRKLAQDLGLEIVALQPLRNFEAVTTQLFEANLRRAERKFALMEQLGTTRLLVCSNVLPDCIDDRDLAARQLRELARRARCHGFQIGYEALAWGTHVNDYRQSIDIVRRADSENLGVVLDSFHIFVRGHSAAEIETLRPQEITLIQIADAPRLTMDVLNYSRHFRCFPGQGAFPVQDFVSRVRASGYDGYLSLEIFNDEFRSSRADVVARDGQRSLSWLEHASAQPVACNSARSERTMPRELVRGIEFIEFATDPDHEEELATLLQGLGFAETHRHRSKDVSLYRSGEVNIVLNRTPNSHASDYFDKHGVAICAIGLAVGDSKAMIAWADQYECPRYDSNANAGELQLPAICGPGDVLYYFLEPTRDGRAFYDIDFRPTGRQPVDHLLTGVDNIGQVVLPEYFLSTALFNRTVLGLDSQHSVELTDPYGIVTSRMARSFTSGISITLMMSRAWAAAPRRFIESFGGGGMQQVALRTTDIFSVAEQLEPSVILPIGANYYRDLEARMELPPEMLARMERLSILYNRDDSGEMFHQYLRDQNGLFFEIVQRSGECAAAPDIDSYARLAAQQEDWSKRRRGLAWRSEHASLGAIR